jgi:predicted dehydrogenase
MLSLESEGRTKVLATCDPRADALRNICEKFQFAERGVHVYTGFEELLAQHGGQLDLINVSTPIRLHAPMHAGCVARGIPCYLEKPPTLDPDELRVMIGRDFRARKATQVGFIYIAQPERIELKRQIIAGTFGRLLRVSFQGLGMRSHAYYSRNNWAGRLAIGDDLVLDSCCGNAMAHHIHNILFFAGTSELMNWAAPAWVESELYRANAIESADTIFARGELENGVEFRVAATHACQGSLCQETLTFEKGEIRILPWERTEFRHFGECQETREICGVSLADNLGIYFDYLEGKRSRPLTLLSDCRPMVDLNALFYIAASKITSVKEPHRLTMELEQSSTKAEVITGIEDACRDFVQEARFPSDAGLGWAVRGGRADIGHLKDLRQSLDTIRANLS